MALSLRDSQHPSVAAGAFVVTCCYPLQVEDPLPPVFSGTPKGSGAGYGVGFDLEEFLNQSFDMGVADGPQDGQADSASLSASLLADWLEGHGINPADIESLQREIQMDSPMLLADLADLQEP